jgi:hypothetical protein
MASARTQARSFVDMKLLTLVFTFLPLIAFSLLSRFLPHDYISVAGLTAAVIALIAMATGRPIWPPKILSTCSLVLFALIAVLGFTLGTKDDRWLATWGGAGVGLVIGLIILALIPVIPFTEQFARETAPRASWGSPAFKKINRVLSIAWGGAIFAVGLSRVAAAAIDGHATRLPAILLSLAVPAVIIVYMLRFSKSYPARFTRNEPATPPPTSAAAEQTTSPDR